MKRYTDQLIEIVKKEKALLIDATNKTTEQLIEVTSNVILHKTKIIITNIHSKTTDQLVKIASAGNGNVIFDVR